MLQTLPAAARHQGVKENRPLDSDNDNSDSRLPSLDAAIDDVNSQTRILRLRKARFRGVVLPPRNTAPVGLDSPPTTAEEDNATDAELAWNINAAQHQLGMGAVSPEEASILREISNSSMRRKQGGKGNSNSRPSSKRSSPQKPKNKSPYNRSTPRSMSVEDYHKSSARRSAGHSSSPSAFNEYEVSKYVEHLEYQLAAVNTQLQSVTSPSTSRVHSAKLRALTQESTVLRQEVTDWESKFTERLREQTEQHEMAFGGLKAQLRNLERDTEDMREKIQMLESEGEGKDSQIESLGQVNQDLERRLEVMTELLATSSARFELVSRRPSDGGSRSSRSRPHSMVLPISSASPTMSPSRRRPESTLSDDRRASIASSQSRQEQSPLSPMRHASIREAPLDDDDSDVSESNPLEDAQSPRRRIHLQRMSSDTSERVKTRKMRRFYGGAAGPRTLILPNTHGASGSHSFSSSISSLRSPPVDARSPFDGRGLGLLQDEFENDARPKSARSDFSTPTGARQVSAASQATIEHHILSELVDDLDDDFGHATIKGAKPTVTESPVELRNLFDELSQDQEHDSSPPAPSLAAQLSTPYLQPVKTPSHRAKSSIASSAVSSAVVPWPDVPRFVTQTPVLTPSMTAATPGDGSGNGRDDDASSWNIASLPGPVRLLVQLAYMLTQTLDRRAPGVSSLLSTVWEGVAFSRPVLEFRLWLIKLLVGDLRRRSRSWPLSPLLLSPRHRDKAASLTQHGNSSHPGLRRRAYDSNHSSPALVRPADPARALTSSHAFHSALLRDSPTGLERFGQAGHPGRGAADYTSATSVQWIQLGVTLLFAVGLAIRNGPGSLLALRPAGGGGGPAR